MCLRTRPHPQRYHRERHGSSMRAHARVGCASCDAHDASWLHVWSRGAETGTRGGLPCDYQYPCYDFGPWNRRLRRCARCGAVDQHRATLLSGPARRRHRWQTLRGVARPRRRQPSARPLPAPVGSKPEARAAAHHSTHRPRERLGPIPPMVLTSQAQPDRPEARRPCGSRARRCFGLARPEAAAGALQRVT